MIDRRNWLRRAGCGFGSLAAAALLQDEVASVAATALAAAAIQRSLPLARVRDVAPLHAAVPAALIA